MSNPAFLSLAVSLAVALPGLAADRAFKPDENGQVVFVTPSRNIGCTYIPKGGTPMYTPDDGGPELGCDRIEPLYVRLVLSASGAAFIFKMEGDSACCSDTNILQYGDSWRAGPFSCSSEQTGLQCSRDDGHGFFASRKKYAVN
ncbi:hypothetical protein [Rhizobium sp. Root1220]|uniref:hypothetical protein n=1 Tax=Rhizobium sp. Root1220 TaxID=1736432 RepID=UPI0006FA83A2|nr:hypothetical protein [Rhizobium sp. Root1220]KQV66071.1 hypothetical protein ASC90_12760 [Rhizobium sp. Root1220]